MKAIILAWIVLVTVTYAARISDGKGLFPVMVQVVDPELGTPIKGANVRLEGIKTFKDFELDPNDQSRGILDTLGKPVATNSEGVAVVFYYGGWSRNTTEGRSIYGRSLSCTIVVEFEGKEIFRSTLKEWAEKNDFRVEPCSAPWIVVSPPATQ